MYIYKITNLINSKIYIGKHMPNSKSNDAIKYFGSGKFIRASILKHGKENFKKEIIEDGINDKKFLCEREIFWIAFYDSTNRNIGYNICKGGEGGGQCSEETRKKLSLKKKGIPMKEQTKKLLSQINTGKKHSEETKLKIRQTILNDVPFKGQKHTEETRKKISSKLKGKFKGMKGRISEAQKEAIRQANRKRFSDPAARQAITDANNVRWKKHRESQK